MGLESRQEGGEDMNEEVGGERKAVCKLCCSSRKGILSVDVLLSAHGLTSHYFCLLFRSGDDCDDCNDCKDLILMMATIKIIEIIMMIMTTIWIIIMIMKTKSRSL